MKNKILVVLLVLIIVINTICCFLLIKNKGGNKMASIKISELNAKTQADDSDLIPIVDSINSETKKITKGNLINDVYSTSEVKTNKKWIDGKPIYRKAVNIGDLTDSSRFDDDGITIVTNISNIEITTSLKVIGIISTGGYNAYIDITNWTYYIPAEQTLDGHPIGLLQWEIYPASLGNIAILFGATKHLVPYTQGVTDGWAIIEYTKTTD